MLERMTLPDRFGQPPAHSCTGTNPPHADHRYEIRLHMQTCDMTTTYDIRSHQGIDHVLDLAIHYRHFGEVNLTMAVLPAVRPLPKDAELRNHMRVDLQPEKDAAAVLITMATEPSEPSTWISKTGTSRPGIYLCWDYWCGGPETTFPDDSIMTIPELREVVHQFYDLNGAGLPAAVAWHQQSESLW